VAFFLALFFASGTSGVSSGGTASGLENLTITSKKLLGALGSLGTALILTV